MNNYIKKSILFAVFSVTFINNYAYCERNNIDVLATSVYFNQVEELFANFNNKNFDSAEGANLKKLNRSIKVKLRVKGIGRFETNLNKQKFFNSQSEKIALLQGEVLKLSGSKKIRNVSFAGIEKISTDLYNLKLFTVNRSRLERNHTWKGLLEISAILDYKNGRLKVKKIKSKKSKRASSDKLDCFSSGKNNSNSVRLANDNPQSKATVKIATVLLEADNEYANSVNISSELANIMNGVDAIYQRDLGLSISSSIPSSPVTYNSNIQLDDSFQFLIHQEMASKRPANSRDEDIHYLFTNKTPVGEDVKFLAGAVPDIGVVCSEPANSIGFTIRFDTTEDILTTAHEIGHLYGGEHDDNSTTSRNPGIMNSGTGEINGEITNFSDFSIEQIGSYVSSNSSCLDLGEGNGGGSGGGGSTPPSTLPATATLEAYKDGKFFVADLYDLNSDEGYSSINVEIQYKKKAREPYSLLRTIATDEDGYVYFQPRKDGTYIFKAENLTSNALKYKKPKKKNR